MVGVQLTEAGWKATGPTSRDPDDHCRIRPEAIAERLAAKLKPTTMKRCDLIERVSVFPSVHQRHRTAPLLKEREQYLTHLLQMGLDADRVRGVAAYFVHIVARWNSPVYGASNALRSTKPGNAGPTIEDRNVEATARTHFPPPLRGWLGSGWPFTVTWPCRRSRPVVLIRSLPSSNAPWKLA
jgi:hypothetical protein